MIHLRKTLILSVISSKCENEDEKVLEKQELRYWDIKNSWFKWKSIITLKTWVKNLDLKIQMKQEIISLKK